MSSELLFALMAGVAMAGYSILSRIAAADIHPSLAATIVTGVAFVANLVLMLTLRGTGSPMPFTMKSVSLIALVGLAAACADFSTLSAYANGMKATSSFLIGGTTTVLVVVIGFAVLREPFSWTKLGAVLLIAVGCLLIQREG